MFGRAKEKRVAKRPCREKLEGLPPTTGPWGPSQPRKSGRCSGESIQNE